MKKFWTKTRMVLAAVLVSAGITGTLLIPRTNATEPRTETPLEIGQTISVVGDMGTGGKGQYAVADSIQISNPILVKTVGDNIYEDGFRTPTDKDFITKFLNVYKYLNIPFEITLGNHDWYAGDPITAWTLASKKHPFIRFHGNFYATKRGDICELHLDTELFDNVGLQLRGKVGLAVKVRDDQEKWIKDMIPKLDKACAIIIAYGHHPYMSSGKGHGDAKGYWAHIFETLLAGKVDFYIAGHEHILADEGTFRGTRLLISGAGGKLEEGLARSAANWAVDELGHLDITLTAERTLEFKFIALIDGKRTLAHRFTVNF